MWMCNAKPHIIWIHSNSLNCITIAVASIPFTSSSSLLSFWSSICMCIVEVVVVVVIWYTPELFSSTKFLASHERSSPYHPIHPLIASLFFLLACVYKMYTVHKMISSQSQSHTHSRMHAKDTTTTTKRFRSNTVTIADSF